MTHAVDDNGEQAAEAAQDWVEYRGRRRIASENAYELLVLAEMVRGYDPRSAVELTNRARWEWEQIGVKGPYADAEYFRIIATAREEATRRRQEARLVLKEFEAWLRTVPEVRS